MRFPVAVALLHVPYGTDASLRRTASAHHFQDVSQIRNVGLDSETHDVVFVDRWEPTIYRRQHLVQFFNHPGLLVIAILMVLSSSVQTVRLRQRLGNLGRFRVADSSVR